MDNKTVLSVARIVASTSTDGPGLRSSLYLQGCSIKCDGCHNSSLWNIKDGKFQSVDEVYKNLMDADEDVSILGGEPLMQYDGIVELCRKIKEETTKDIWLWSGYTYEHIQAYYPQILEYVDVLVDGSYIASLSDASLLFRGSSNQRIIPISKQSEVKYKDIFDTL